MDLAVIWARPMSAPIRVEAVRDAEIPGVILDMSLTNRDLYAGLDVQLTAGRPTLLTPADSAIPVLLANLARLSIDPQEVVLSGGMAIWAYLVVFHYLHGRTTRIFYEDGRGAKVLVAAHG
jgi:hypothetical protein